MKQMHRQWVFFIQDLKQNKIQFSFEWCQIVIAMVLLCYVINLCAISIDTVNKLNRLNEKKIYKIADNSTEEQFSTFINNKANEEKLNKVIKLFTSANDIGSFTIDSSMSLNLDINSDNSSLLRVSSNFFTIFDIKKNFSNNVLKNFDRQYGEKNIPVILGSDFMNRYQVGDTLKDSSAEMSYQVVGFLEKDEYYIDPFQQKDAVYLNNYVIAPKACNLNDTISKMCSLTSTYLIAESEKTIEQKLTLANNMGVPSLTCKSLANQVKVCVNGMLNEILTMLSLFFLVIVFTSAGIINSLNLYIKTHLREFAINLMCGAETIDIFLRIIFRFVVISVTSFMVLCILYNFNIWTFITLGIEVVYFAAVLVLPLNKLKNNSIISIIRRN